MFMDVIRLSDAVVRGSVKPRPLLSEIVFLTLIILSSIATGFCIGLKYARDEAIRHGAAHYDRDSGAFKWNESEAK